MAVTITVKEVRPPNQVGGRGSLIDSSGKLWIVDNHHEFAAGTSYNVLSYENRTSKAGKAYYVMKNYQTIVTNGTVQHQMAQSQQHVQTVSDNQRRMDIFVCGAFNNYLANPSVQVAAMSMMDMVELLQKLKGAWMGVFGPNPLPKRDNSISTTQRNDDMNDDIPF